MRPSATITHIRRICNIGVLVGAALAISSASAASTRLAVTTVTPGTGSTASGSLSWQVNVSNGTPSSVSFAVDGVVLSTVTAAPYEYGGGSSGLDTTTLPNGSHQLTATAWGDKSGGVKSSVIITVANPIASPPPPTATPPLSTSAPLVSGTPQVGQTLTSSSGSWSGTTPMSYSFEWLRCDSTGQACSPIAGASGPSYVFGSTDAKATVRAFVTASNGGGSSSAQSAPSAIVTSPSVSSIYWGAFIDGNDTYDPLYGGNWGDVPWDSNTWTRFQANAGKRVSVVHWGVGTPWTHDFNYWAQTFNLVQGAGDLSLVDMNSGSVRLSDIANGLYDSSLTAWAQQAKAWGHPFFLRFDWEMNGRWFSWGTTSTNQNTPSDFVLAWRHIHDLFAATGASNVTWVWCPNTDFTGSVPLEQLYPGDAYVDWTGMDAYNKSTTTWWRSFSTIFTATYNHLLQITPSKPILIGETSSLEVGGSKASWITDALSTQLPSHFPQIKALIWMNWRIPESGASWDWQIESSSSAQAAFATGISSPYYLPGGGLTGLPLLSKVQPPG